jgi:hypothetical protein
VEDLTPVLRGCFSSHRATLGLAPPWFLDTRRLLSYYGPDRERARARYREHTETPGPEQAPEHPLLAGDDTFLARHLSDVEPAPGIPSRYYRTQPPALADILAQRDSDSLARAHASGYTLREIANHLGCHASTISRKLNRPRDNAPSATNET